MLTRTLAYIHNLSNHFSPYLRKAGTPAAILVFVGLLQGCGQFRSPEPQQALEKLDVNQIKMTMLADISSIIDSDKELACDVKTDISRLALTPLRRSPEAQITGNDSVTRPVAVTFQKAFEQSVLNMVAEGQISKATAIIHTRRPTTPLCNPPGKALSQTMAPALQHDPKRIKTIEDRSITLRKMANNGPPLDLYAAYIKGGLEKRSPQEQNTYKQEVNNPENTSLHDEELTCVEMPDEIVGASYILTTKMGNTLYFGNNGTQAADAAEKTIWNYWFGSLKETPVDKRYKEVMNYLRGCGMHEK